LVSRQFSRLWFAASCASTSSRRLLNWQKSLGICHSRQTPENGILLDVDCLGKHRSPCDACAKLGASSRGRSSMRIRSLFAVLGLSTIVGSSLLSQVTERVKVPDRPPLMEQEREMKMALSAAPSHLRDGAGVYVLRAHGYEKAHDTSNGFTCIV